MSCKTFSDAYQTALKSCALIALTMVVVSPVVAQTTPPTTPEPTPITSEAEKVYGGARDKLLQIRTLVSNTGQQSSLGSAFLVDASGLAITNYHVISDFALEPQTYKLEYLTADDKRGKAELLAIDVVNDLAVIKIDKVKQPFFKFNPAALSGKSFKGERLFAMGNPLNIGFAIVEGTNNGIVDRSYNNRIHFTGAINAGMSGGPAVTSDNQVVGINVSKMINKDLVSFLVPAQFAVSLIQKAKTEKPLILTKARSEVSRQMIAWQDGLYKDLAKAGFSSDVQSRYAVPKSEAPWFNCWSTTNANDKPSPLAVQSSTHCDLDSQMFLNGDSRMGGVRLSHTYAKTTALNPFQFSSFIEDYYFMMPLANDKGIYNTRRFCHENLVTPENAANAPVQHIVWCGQGYRDFEGIYDVSVLSITHDNDYETLVSRLSMKGVSYDNAMMYASRFLGALQWVK